MKRLKLGVQISGRGSNLQSLIDACRDPDFPAEIVGVISNRPGAKGLERAAAASIPAKVIDHTAFDERAAFETELDAAHKEWGTELICNAGFMRIMTADFVNRWKDRMINIHPSLLPSFPGLHTHERVLEKGILFTGCTVHFVRPQMDDGPIIVQAAVPVLDDDTAEALGARVLEAEHKIYPYAVRLIAEGKVRVAGHIVKFSGVERPAFSLINPTPPNA